MHIFASMYSELNHCVCMCICIVYHRVSSGSFTVWFLLWVCVHAHVAHKNFGYPQFHTVTSQLPTPSSISSSKHLHIFLELCECVYGPNKLYSRFFTGPDKVIDMAREKKMLYNYTQYTKIMHSQSVG